ncbi:NAD dependent epimerase [Cordyceps militaris]|uniref:NAD dependent epimerase n=1 Tax=Cordyceps militaris TaxID=73501 RepID=A0A2H4SEU4_CORMI|nr:NAD dependent epimerase [Cordyceps militaris]
MSEYQNPIQPRHTKEMKALVLGLPRTGTSSLCSALTILGLKTFFETKNGGIFSDGCRPAIDAKYRGDGAPPTKEDFDQIVGDFNVLAGSPCWMFVDELLAAYPDAKVILSTRPPEAWLQSLRQTVFALLGSRTWGVASLADRFAALHWRLLHRIYFTLSQGEEPWRACAERPLLQSYHAHNEYVRRRVPASRLLEYRPGDGWGPLCAFLDVEVPKRPFPHTNGRTSFVETERARYWSLWRKMGVVLAKGLLVVGLVLVLAFSFV